MFDATFFAEVLPDIVLKECKTRPDHVPVVHIHLADSSILDVCHVVHLAPNWFGVAFYRDPQSCDDMDIAFLPYGLVTRLTLVFHRTESRKLGFRVAEHVAAGKVAAKRGRRG